MEFIIELLVELIFEGAIELSKSKKTPFLLRIFLIILIVLFFISVICLMLFISYLAFKNNWLIISLFLLFLTIIVFIQGILKFKKNYLNEKSIKNNKKAL